MPLGRRGGIWTQMPPQVMPQVSRSHTAATLCERRAVTREGCKASSVEMRAGVPSPQAASNTDDTSQRAVGLLTSR